MTSKWDDDSEEIVVDDQVRDDGLNAEGDPSDPSKMEPLATSSELSKLSQAMGLILQRLEVLSGPAKVPDPSLLLTAIAELNASIESLDKRFDGLEQQFVEVAAGLTSPKHLVDESTPIESGSESRKEDGGEEAAGRHDLELLIFGIDLANQQALKAVREQLLFGVVEQQDTAVSLAARLMLVQVASAEELPLLVKEIGEAYYRRYPKTTDSAEPFEESLVTYLHKRLAEVGLQNSIELIHLGDRYDAARHISPDRGVEVVEVRGWSVLRNNGKPLTKASVSLR